MSAPKVSIIVTTYSIATKPYLDLCIESIRNLNYPKESLEVIVCCHKQQAMNYTKYYSDLKVVSPIESQYYNPRGLNFGIECASADSKYYFILNDDVILTRDSLANLVAVAGDMPVILQPISPCDNYRAYSLMFGFMSQGKPIPMVEQFYRLPQVEGMTTDMMNAESSYPVGTIRAEFLCMFASLIPKSVWSKVGAFDEMFKTGQDDIDYSKRCHINGVSLHYCLSSLVWHFGGVTADDSISVEKRKENIRYFKDKWGELPPGMPANILDTLDDSYKFKEVAK